MAIRRRKRHFLFIDDWLIFSKDEFGQLWYVSTEMWSAWADLPEHADQELNAIAKYMLPVAFKSWDLLDWQLARGDYGRIQTAEIVTKDLEDLE